MRKIIYIRTFMVLMLICLNVNILVSQLNGTYTIPGNYNSIRAAILALNSQGVSGNTTFNVTAGWREQASNLTITASGSPTSHIKFIKSGTGNNPLITAASGYGSHDGIIKLYGVNYITFDGINLQDSTGNLDSTTQMEWGYALIRKNAAQGCQFDTIRNCSIMLNKSNTFGSWGIYSKNIDTSGAAIIPTALSGTNSNNTFININISSTSFGGFYIYGYADTNGTFIDQNNIITSNGLLRSSVTNFGFSNAMAWGIYAWYQNGLTISNTYINNYTAGSVSPSLIGIYLGLAVNANQNVTGDTITLAGNGVNYLYGRITAIESQAGELGINNTININNNVITGCNNSSSTSADFWGIDAGGSYNLNINGNQITGNSLGSSTQTSYGDFYLINAVGAKNICNINNNNLSNNKRFQSTLSGGRSEMIYYNGPAITTNINGNIISNDTFPSNDRFYGLIYYNTLYPTATTVNINNNRFTGIYFPLNSPETFYGFYYEMSATTNNIFNNSFSNITSTGPSPIYPIYWPSYYDTCNIYQDTIYNIHSNGGMIYGIYSGDKIFNNKIYGLYSTGDSVYGICAVGFYNYVYNNFISDLRSTSGSGSNVSPAIVGINCGGSQYTGLYYNTIFLNGDSTSSTFWTAGVFLNLYCPLDLRNNIIENISTPGSSSGYTCAFLLSSNYSLSNYSSLSNNNCFYAGTPAANRLIYYDGINQIQTLSSYKALVAPRDSYSISENPPFVNISALPYDLHLSACAATGCESGGQDISSPISIITDYDNQPRFPYTGYPVCLPAHAPDIGADEFGGTPSVYYSISGTIRFQDNNQIVNAGNVKAIKYDRPSNQIITVDSTNIQPNGTYSLIHIPHDSIYIMAFEDDEALLQYVPTYYPSSINWQNAAVLYPAGNINNINVLVYRINNAGGQYHLGGHVYLNSQVPLTGLSGAILYAKLGNNFQAYSVSNGTGSYRIDSLLSGGFNIIVDRMGYSPLNRNVSLSSYSKDTIDFIFNPIGIEKIGTEIPKNYWLGNNYPNPFNPTTTIKFGIPKTSLVKIIIYDILGKEVTTIMDEQLHAGYYSVSWDAGKCASSVYFYKIQANDFVETKKLVVLK